MAIVSVLSKSRRSALRLMIGMIIGGFGCGMAYIFLPEVWWKIFACGAAAVMTEHALIGMAKLSEEFATDPWGKISSVFSGFSITFNKK